MTQIAALVALADMIRSGEVPDDKIAGMAGCKPEDVAAYRADLEAEAATKLAGSPADAEALVDAKAPSRGKGKDGKSESKPARRAAEHERSELERAAQQLLAQGWTLRDGALVPPMKAQPDSELAIRVTRAYRHQFRNARGKLLSVTIPRSVYRGAMARAIMEKVPPELIERL